MFFSSFYSRSWTSFTSLGCLFLSLFYKKQSDWQRISCKLKICTSKLVVGFGEQETNGSHERWKGGEMQLWNDFDLSSPQIWHFKCARQDFLLRFLYSIYIRTLRSKVIHMYLALVYSNTYCQAGLGRNECMLLCTNDPLDGFFYNVKNELSFITSKSSSENLNNQNKHLWWH